MERREVFSPMEVTSVRVRVWSAALTVITTQESEITVTAKGNEGPVSELTVEVRNGVLTVTEPFMKTIFHKTGTEKVLTVRLPVAWKGSFRLLSAAGMTCLSDLDGSDITVRTLTGSVDAGGLRAMLVRAVTWTGHLIFSDILTDKAVFRTLTGPLSVRLSAAEKWVIRSFCAPCEVMTKDDFIKFSGVSLFSDLELENSLDSVDAAIRSVTGKIRTEGQDLRANAPKIRHRSLTGDLLLFGSMRPEDPAADESGLKLTDPPAAFPYDGGLPETDRETDGAIPEMNQETKDMNTEEDN